MTTLEETTVETNWINREFKNIGIRCGRTIKRFIKTMETLSNNIQASILGASENVAEAKAIYRMVKNETLTEPVILSSHCKATLQQIKESKSNIILAIQDTTELNYTSHSKTEDLGDGTA
ncbi:MAG: transposase DNA-binding-containing protein, partial [Bacillota bacterium]|nr:transposase DNA-binding-containing protein [Bacillota bacterium]